MRLPPLIARHEKSSRPPLDRLFVLSHARSRLERQHRLAPRDASAVVFHPVAPEDFVQILRLAEDAVEATASDTTVEGSNDPYAFGWLIVRNDTFEDLVLSVHAISAALEEAGWWERLLCAVFSFEDNNKRQTYWTYNYQSGAFSPIAPARGNLHRDTERERLLKAQLRSDDTAEPQLRAWLPLWGIPI